MLLAQPDCPRKGPPNPGDHEQLDRRRRIHAGIAPPPSWPIPSPAPIGCCSRARGAGWWRQFGQGGVRPPAHCRGRGSLCGLCGGGARYGPLQVGGGGRGAEQ